MVKVDWIIPVEYSEPTWIAARTTEMSAAASTPRIPTSRISLGCQVTHRPALGDGKADIEHHGHQCRYPDREQKECPLGGNGGELDELR